MVYVYVLLICRSCFYKNMQEAGNHSLLGDDVEERLTFVSLSFCRLFALYFEIPICSQEVAKIVENSPYLFCSFPQC